MAVQADLLSVSRRIGCLLYSAILDPLSSDSIDQGDVDVSSITDFGYFGGDPGTHGNGFARGREGRQKGGERDVFSHVCPRHLAVIELLARERSRSHGAGVHARFSRAG